MTPTFVFKDQEPFLIVGSPGGTAIIGTVLNLIVNLVDFQMPLHHAVNRPRIINRNGPLELEGALFYDAYLKRELERRGHPVIQRDSIGNVQAITFDHKENVIIGISDSRGEGEALGY